MFLFFCFFFFFQAEDGIRDLYVTGVQTCALPIFPGFLPGVQAGAGAGGVALPLPDGVVLHPRSEEHTSELQSRRDLVCRLLLEKKKRWERRRWGRHLRSGGGAITGEGQQS